MIHRHKYSKYAITSLLLAFLLIGQTSCSKDDNEIPSTGEAYWKVSSTVNASTGSSAIFITGAKGLEWKAEVTEGNGWCSFDNKDYTKTTTSGSIGDFNILYVYYKANGGTSQREAKISFRFEGANEQIFTLLQLSESQENLPAFGLWAEIPAKKDNANYRYVTHYVMLNNKTIRNYSICFDKTKKASLWVAYPIHQAYLKGSGKREDTWAFDPFIPVGEQLDGVSGTFRGYDRGHQIASADRLGTQEMNAQTFYMSNMTPQLNSLNGSYWATLESKVRTYSCSDTLYVVTGAYYNTGFKTTMDASGNVVPVPTNYFKVLLRTRKGNTGKAIKDCTDNELETIGFWLDHKAYSGSLRNVCTTVADIEQKTGFSFFPQVSNLVKSQNNPAQWDIN
jgi:endonuclease G